MHAWIIEPKKISDHSPRDTPCKIFHEAPTWRVAGTLLLARKRVAYIYFSPLSPTISMIPPAV